MTNEPDEEIHLWDDYRPINEVHTQYVDYKSFDEFIQNDWSLADENDRCILRWNVLAPRSGSIVSDNYDPTLPARWHSKNKDDKECLLQLLIANMEDESVFDYIWIPISRNEEHKVAEFLEGAVVRYLWGWYPIIKAYAKTNTDADKNPKL